MIPHDPRAAGTNLGLSYRFAVSLLLVLVRHSCTQGEEIDAVAFQLLTPPALRGNLSSNNILLNAERIHPGQISSPHSYVAIGDDMYAATASGLVVNIAACRPVVIANLRPRGCRTIKECGHLVSIRLTKENLLMVLDAYRGVFEVHPVTGVIRQLYDSRTLVNGRPTIYLNDLVILADDTIIMSDSSSRFNYDREFWIRFEGRPDGRLIGFSPANGQSREILTGLAYPTGLEITYSGQALLVSEASRARILRLELSKNKFFQRSYVNINLPGMPEHIRKSGRGTYWVGMSYPRYRGGISLLDHYSSKPESRNFMALRRTMNEIRFMYKSRGLAVELDEVGRILRSIHDYSGMKVGEVLEVTEYSGVLYVGTRAQHATVRVVGSPNELTVDSLVQVLRGRCKVTEDKVQATKESIERQLKGNPIKEPTKSTAAIQESTSSPRQTITGDTQSFKTEKPKTEKPRHVINLKMLSQSLSKLHKKLFNATANTKKPPQAIQTLPQVVPLNVAPRPQEVSSPAPKEYIPVHQTTTALNNLQINTQYIHTTTVSFKEPFQPLQRPQNTIPPQASAGKSTMVVAQLNVSSYNEPHLKHSFQGGQLTSHVILTPKEQELLTGYLTRPQQRERPYSDLPNQPSSPPTYKHTHENISPTISFNNPSAQGPTQNTYQNMSPTLSFNNRAAQDPAQNIYQNVSPALSFNNRAAQDPTQNTYQNMSPTLSFNKPASHYTTELQQRIVTPRSAAVSVTQQTSPPETAELGGFMGFLGNSAGQNGAQDNRREQTTPQDPYSFSVPDPELYGQIEPALGMNAGSSSNTHHFLPGMESFVGFEQLTLSNDQTPRKGEQMLVNQSQTIPSQVSPHEPVNSFKFEGQKRPDMNVQDILMKDASAIQNMQMFHPTDRPDQLPQLQNQAEAKTVPSFHEKAPLNNYEVQQFQGISLDHQPKEAYSTARNDQLPLGGHNEVQQNSQYVSAFGQARHSSSLPGSAMIDMSQSAHFSSNGHMESFDPGAPLHQGSPGNIYRK